MVSRDDAEPTRIRVIRYNADELTEHEPADAAELFDMIEEGKVVWADIVGLRDTDLIREIGLRFGLHPLAVADVANVGQRPKAEDYVDRLFVVTRMIRVDEQGEILAPEQVSLFLGPGFVLTFQERGGDCLDPLRDRLRGNRPLIRGSGSDYLACMVVDAIIDGYFPVIETFGERLEELEQGVLTSPNQNTLARIFTAKRELMNLRRAVWPQREFLNGLIRERHPLMSPEVIPYLRDAYDHSLHIMDVIEVYRELAGSLVDVFLSSVGNRTNEVMRVLTVLASIFIPLTFVAGIYGMNFDTSVSKYNLPELEWKYGYLMFWGVCLVIIGGLLLLFRRLGWLGGRGR